MRLSDEEYLKIRKQIKEDYINYNVLALSRLQLWQLITKRISELGYDSTRADIYRINMLIPDTKGLLELRKNYSKNPRILADRMGMDARIVEQRLAEIAIYNDLTLEEPINLIPETTEEKVDKLVSLIEENSGPIEKPVIISSDEKSINNSREELKKLEEKIENLNQELNKKDDKIENLEAQLYDDEAVIRRLQESLASANKIIKTLEVRLLQTMQENAKNQGEGTSFGIQSR